MKKCNYSSVNLFTMAEDVTKYYLKYYYIKEKNFYIRHLIFSELFILILKHLSNVYTKSCEFNFKKAMQKIEKIIKKDKKKLYLKWLCKKFDKDYFKLKTKINYSKNKLTIGEEYYYSFIKDYVPYNYIKQNKKLKNELGII